MNEKESHGHGCVCDRCFKRRVYFRVYYEWNRARILRKNRAWAKTHRKYPGLTREQVTELVTKQLLEKYGRDHFSKIKKGKTKNRDDQEPV